MSHGKILKVFATNQNTGLTVGIAYICPLGLAEMDMRARHISSQTMRKIVSRGFSTRATQELAAYMSCVRASSSTMEPVLAVLPRCSARGMACSAEDVTGGQSSNAVFPAAP